MPSVEPVRRDSEIEEFTNLHFIHPLSNTFTEVFADLNFSPNMVSVLGMLCGVSAGVAYYHYHSPIFALVGFLLMIGWHILDGADGQLARLLQAQSEVGKIIDGICDYVTFASVYVGLGLAISDERGNWVWLLIVASGVAHAAQAAAYEVQRQEYNYWGLKRKSAELPWPEELRARSRGQALPRRILVGLYRAYVWMQYRVSGASTGFRRDLARMLDRQPADEALIRAKYREIFAPSVRRWAILSSNYRTIAIFVCALLQAPLGYFLFELVGFSLILAGLSYAQRSRYAAMAACLRELRR